MVICRFAPFDVRNLWGRFDNKTKQLIQVIRGECPDDDETTNWGPLACAADLGKAIYLEDGEAYTPSTEQVCEAVELPKSGE